MELVKHAVGALTTPLTIAFLVGALGVVYRPLGRPRTGNSLLVVGAAIAYLGAIDAVGDQLLGILERQYSPLLEEDGPFTTVGYIVTLGSGYSPRDHVSVTAALDEDGLVRIVESIRLMRRFGIPKLVVSGGSPEGKVAPALGYSQIARDLGVADASILLSARPLDTNAEAVAITKLLGSEPFILVTSAYHMPRAMWLMRRAGGHPIPAPAGQRSGGDRSETLRAFLPSSSGLRKTERAFHEYLGFAALLVGVA